MQKWFYAFVIVSMCSCGPQDSTPEIPKGQSAIPPKISITTFASQYATGFEIESSAKGYTIQIKNPATGELHQKVFVPEGSTNTFSALSSTHIGMLGAIDALDLVQQINRKAYVYNQIIRDRVDSGLVDQVGIGGQVNLELLLTSRANVVTTSDLEFSALRPDLLNTSGKEIVSILEWMEPHVLGRLEWVKVFGALTNQLERATVYFEQQANAYLAAIRDSSRSNFKTSVLIGNQYNGTWHVPGGKSYMAQLIADAGGTYLWKSNEQTGGVAVSYEEVLVKGKTCTTWINPGTHRDLSSLQGEDERYIEFVSFNNGSIYNHTGRVRDDGANDYWETGVVQPVQVLRDLSNIFQAKGGLYYYQKLKAE